MKKILFLFAIIALVCGCSKDDASDAQGGIVELSMSELKFDAAGNVINSNNEVKVNSQSVWELVGKDVWCKPSAKKGKGGDVVRFEVEPNLSGESRTLTYSFVSGTTSSKLLVTQLPAFDITSDKSEYNVTSAGEKILVVLNSNMKYKIEIPEKDQSWVSNVTDLSKATSVEWLIFNVKANDTYKDRSSAVVLIAESGEAKTVTFSQKQNDAVEIESSTVQVGSAGGSVTVNFKANIDLSMEVLAANQSWLTMDGQPDYTYAPGQGLQKGSLRLTVGVATLSRMGFVVVKSKDGSFSQNISLFQKGTTSQYFDVPDSTMRVLLQSLGYSMLIEGNKMELLQDGAQATELSCLGKGIKSLKGIEVLTNLTTLDCSSNALEGELNLNSLTNLVWLNCSRNMITTLDVSACSKLTTLSCHYNPFNVINLGKSKVASISMYYNKLYNNGVYSKNLTVRGENCSDVVVYNNNELEWLDVSGCMLEMRQVDCDPCPKLTALYFKTGQTAKKLYKPSNISITYKD